MFENLKTIWGADIFILAKEKAHPFPALHVKKTNQNKTQNQIRTKPQNQTKPNKLKTKPNQEHTFREVQLTRSLNMLSSKCLQVPTQVKYHRKVHTHKRQKSLSWESSIQIIWNVMITYLPFLISKHLKSYTKQEWVTVVNQESGILGVYTLMLVSSLTLLGLSHKQHLYSRVCFTEQIY